MHHQLLTITRAEREAHSGHMGKVVWFTGLSGSGKSTVANALEVALYTQGRHTYILDGDNIRRIAEVAKLMREPGGLGPAWPLCGRVIAMAT